MKGKTTPECQHGAKQLLMTGSPKRQTFRGMLAGEVQIIAVGARAAASATPLFTEFLAAGATSELDVSQ